MRRSFSCRSVVGVDLSNADEIKLGEIYILMKWFYKTHKRFIN